jgi:hypothetical protein
VSADDDGFVSRWARRKALARSGVAAPAEKLAPGGADGAAAKEERVAMPPASLAAGAPVAVAPAEGSVQAPTPASVGQPPVLPTMADVARLTRNSDFACFVGPGVDPGVSNAAMKKLFSDPRYNVMDGLDTYIGDYNTPDPIPLAMLRQMNQSAFLGLFDHEIEAEQKDNDEQRSEQADTGVAVGSEVPAPAASLSLPEPAGMRACVATSRIRIDDDTDL